jgi:hypothetical protein
VTLAMFNFLLLVVTLLPLLGLFMMEAGAYGTDILDYGHYNGASLAYAVHLNVMLGAYAVTFWVLSHSALHLRPGRPHPRPAYSTVSFRRLAWLALLLNVLLLGFVLFVSGAWNVVFGSVDKGLFRTQARFGYFAFLSRDFLSPMLSALTAFVYLRCNHGVRETALLGANLLVTASAGAIWGFRGLIPMMLFPAALILVRRITLGRSAALAAGALVVIVLSSTYYQGYAVRAALNAVLTRATVGTGNTAWRVWDIATTAPETIPPYAPTLTSMIGSRIRRLAGFETEVPLDVSLWNPTDYTTLATLLIYDFSPGVNPRSNVTTGIFGEAVVALGTKWFPLMSLAAGILIGLVRAVFEFAQQNYRPILAVMATGYFLASLFSWLHSGGLNVLLSVPLVVSYLCTYGVAAMLLRGARIPAAPRVPMPRRRSVDGRSILDLERFPAS